MTTKVALITGGSSGIGKAVAEVLRGEYKIAIVGSKQEKLDSACEDLTSAGVSILPIALDLGIKKNAEEIVHRVIEQFGRLDLLVNNVGVYRDTNATDKTSFNLYLKIMEINVNSIIRTSMEAVPFLEKTKGKIIFVSSVASVKPSKNNYAYRVSKAALSSYAKCLSIDVASKGITVNIVSPGPVDTAIQRCRLSNEKLTPEELNANVGAANLVGRIGKPIEVANTIAFLASSKSSFISGTEIFVDGGYLTKG